MVLTAITSRPKIRAAVTEWRNAFQRVGRTDHGFSSRLIWVEDAGIWLSARGWENGNRYRYWNGLGDRLGGVKDRNLIVEVNPPDGGKPGRFQGLVAEDAAGMRCLLHAGEMNVDSQRVQLRDHDGLHGLHPVSVRSAEGVVRSYFIVTSLGGDPRSMVEQTKKFVEACRLVRISVGTGSASATNAARNAKLLDEALGKFLVGPQEAKLRDRVHAKVWHQLKGHLERSGYKVANERVSSLGPDLYTYDEAEPRLFEIKTATGSSDFLKAIGQLIVYEKVLDSNYRKILVVPEGLSNTIVTLLKSLKIDVATYAVGKTYKFVGL